MKVYLKIRELLEMRVRWASIPRTLAPEAYARKSAPFPDWATDPTGIASMKYLIVNRIT